MYCPKKERLNLVVEMVIYLLRKLHSSTWHFNLLLVCVAQHTPAVLKNRNKTCLFSYLFCLNYKIHFSDMVIGHNAYEIHNLLF